MKFITVPLLIINQCFEEALRKIYLSGRRIGLVVVTRSLIAHSRGPGDYAMIWRGFPALALPG